jgi:hypothetical protein
MVFGQAWSVDTFVLQPTLPAALIRRLILVGILGSQKIWLALPVWGATNVEATTDLFGNRVYLVLSLSVVTRPGHSG